MDGQLSLKSYLDALDSCYSAYQAKKPSLQRPQIANWSTALLPMILTTQGLTISRSTTSITSCSILGHASLYPKPTLVRSTTTILPSPHIRIQFGPRGILKAPRDQSFADKAVEKLSMNLAKQRFEQRVQPRLQLPTLCGNMYRTSVYGALISLICDVDGWIHVAGQADRNVQLRGRISSFFL